MAAAYTAGIVRNYPFVDGNKRVGFVIGILILEINGYTFVASEEQAAQAVINLASGKFDELGYAQFLEQNVARRKQRERRQIRNLQFARRPLRIASRTVGKHAESDPKFSDPTTRCGISALSKTFVNSRGTQPSQASHIRNFPDSVNRIRDPYRARGVQPTLDGASG